MELGVGAGSQEIVLRLPADAIWVTLDLSTSISLEFHVLILRGKNTNHQTGDRIRLHSIHEALSPV